MDILPCPFCGNTDVEPTRYDVDVWDDRGGNTLYCVRMIMNIVFAPVFALMVFWLISLVPELKLSSRRFGLSIAVIVAAFLAFLALVQADVPTDLEAVDEDAEVVETHSLASLKTDSRLDGKAALSFGYLTEQGEYAVMVRQSDGGYRKKRYPADGTVVYEDADTDAARVEVVDRYVVLRETHEFPIVGEWTRDRREFSKREIRIHVPAGSIVQGEYDLE